MSGHLHLLFGYAQADITPTGPVETIGFGRADEMSRGVMSSLSAQISVWQLGEERCCLAAIDHIGFSRQHANVLRDIIGNTLLVPREKVMLCFSHTHSAPIDSDKPDYFGFVCEKIKQCVNEALQSMSAVTAAWANAYGGIGLNRRMGSDESDNRIGILKICDESGCKPRLLLLRLTAHANVLKSDNYLISPDYFGSVRDVLNQRFGCPVMVTQGAAGNIAPKYFKSDTNPPDADERFIRSDSALDDMAQAVLSSAAPVIDGLCPQNVKTLAMYSREIELASEVPPYGRALKIAKEASDICGINGSGWLDKVRQLQEKGVTQQTEQVEVQYFSLDNGCLCGVANEIMCEFALRASAMLQNDLFHFGGYTNGCTGYFPTEEEFDKGGYEVYWSMLIFYIYHGRVFPLRRDSATDLIRFAVENAPGWR